MANICFNTLEVSGEEKDLKKFDAKFARKHLEVLRLYVNDKEYMNKTLKDIKVINKKIVEEYGSEILYASYQKEGYSFNNFIEISINDYINNNSPCSVKWDSGSDLYDLTVKKEKNRYYYVFNTNWCGADNAIYQMSSDFPSLLFDYKYSEDGDEIAVAMICNHGMIILREEAESDMIAYREFLKKHDMQEYKGSCPHCGCLLDEADVDDNLCPSCDELLK